MTYRFNLPGESHVYSSTAEEWCKSYASYARAADHGNARNKPNGLKPPHSWLLIQAANGRDDVTAISIWHRRYTIDRKLSIWLNATDDDFRRAGYLY